MIPLLSDQPITFHTKQLSFSVLNTNNDIFSSFWIKCSVVIEFLFTIMYISNSYQSDPMYCTGFDMLVVLNRHVMQTSTISNQLVYWINKLVDIYGLMHWRVDWCVESTCSLTFTNSLTCWLVCWTYVLFDVYWCTDMLIGMLDWHVGWINMLVDYRWCIDVLVCVLDRYAVCIVRYIITMYYTSIININTTPSSELVLLWLLCQCFSDDFPWTIYHIYVAIITKKMVSFIATNVSADPISFSICLITPTSTILFISPMITLIYTMLIVSMIISIYILNIRLMVTSISTIYLYWLLLWS